MGTRSAVAIPEGDGFRGRYVHWDGYPEGVGAVVQLIVDRDGREQAVQTLLHDHYGWSTVDGEPAQELGIGYTDGRFVAVPGYGVAYTTHDGQSSPDQWITDPDSWGIEYVHIITTSGRVMSYDVDDMTTPLERVQS